jgi:hypothetical protein
MKVAGIMVEEKDRLMSTVMAAAITRSGILAGQAAKKLVAIAAAVMGRVGALLVARAKVVAVKSSAPQ